MDLVTTPGHGLFDASVMNEIVRINKINTEYTQCTSDRRLIILLLQILN